MKFAERIKQLRGREKQTDFAKRIGVHAITLCAYETGKRIPGIDVLERICTEFSVSSDWLIGLTDSRTIQSGSASASAPGAIAVNYSENAKITPFSHCKDCVTVSILRDVVKELMEDARRAAEAKLK